jgi:hypothetical protein
MPLSVRGAAGEWHAIESRQFIGRLPDTALAGELLASIPLDMTEGPLATTRLATLSHLYDRIKWNHVALVYVPTCSAATEGAVTLASWTDPTRSLADYAEGSNRINAALTMEQNVVNSQLWQGTGLMPDEIETPRFQSTKGFANDDDELRFQAAGRLEAMALSSWTQTSSPGLLYIEASVIAQNDIIVPGVGPAPGKDAGEGSFMYISGNSGALPAGSSVAELWLYPDTIPFGPTPKGDGNTVVLSLDRASQPSGYDATGHATQFRLGSGLAAVGASSFEHKAVVNYIGIYNRCNFKLPFGVWYVSTTLGFNGTAGLNKVGRLVFGTSSHNGRGGIAVAVGTPMVNGFGAGTIETAVYELTSSFGMDEFSVTRVGGTGFVVSSGASISCVGISIHRNADVAAETVLFDSFIARKIMSDPTGAQELSVREKDAGEASYAYLQGDAARCRGLNPLKQSGVSALRAPKGGDASHVEQEHYELDTHVTWTEYWVDCVEGDSEIRKPASQMTKDDYKQTFSLQKHPELKQASAEWRRANKVVLCHCKDCSLLME